MHNLTGFLEYDRETDSIRTGEKVRRYAHDSDMLMGVFNEFIDLSKD